MKRQIIISLFSFLILSAIFFAIPQDEVFAQYGERIVGRIQKDGAYSSNTYNITSNDGKIASWWTDATSMLYGIGRWPPGTQVTISLNNPDLGYTCIWWFHSDPDNPSGPTARGGNGCTTTLLTIGNGGYSEDWQNHLWFFLYPIPTPTSGSTPTPTPPTPTPTPNLTLTPYPTIVITGVFKEDAGDVTSCTNNSFTPDASSLQIAITPAFPAGITPICPTSIPGDTSYSCSVKFDNQNTPGVIPNQDLTLYTNYPISYGYSPVGWRNPNSCSGGTLSSISVNVANPIPTTTYERNIYFTYNTGNNWFKLSNTSFNIRSNIGNNTIPSVVNAYDTENDTTDRYLIIRNGGIVTNSGNIALGTDGNYSNNNWDINSYGLNNSVRPADLAEYAKSRKEYNGISNLTDIRQNAINVLTCTPSPCNVNINNGTVNNDPFILIVNGDVTINQNNKFNPSNPKAKSIAIMATGKITFSPNTEEARGIFIADQIDIGTTADQGLLIIGNLIALNQTDFTNTRNVSDKTRPSLFIVFDAKKYIDLLPILSTSKYDWNQLQ